MAAPTPSSARLGSRLGDARHGKLGDNLIGFGRALRRAGVRVDSAQMALAQQAATLVGLQSREDLSAALEAVLTSREEDRMVLRELFDAYFRDPEVANKLLGQMLPKAAGGAELEQRRPRVREALTLPRLPQAPQPEPKDQPVDLDAAMSASELQRLHHADFNGLTASEYQLVERLARQITLAVPTLASRRNRPARRGGDIHWSGALRRAARHGGEWLELPRLQPRQQPLPLLILVDVSGSMERYARLLLAFLHRATQGLRRRDVFAFGTELTDLSAAFRLADTDAMLAASTALIADYAGGTRLGESLETLRHHHARRLVGRRTLVLLISDGLDTGEPAQLDASLQWLHRHCRRLLWLNPLLRFDAYAPVARGAAVLHRHADGMLAVHNLSKLEQLAAGLAAVMKQ